MTFFGNFCQYSGDSIHAQWMFMQQVEHENFVLKMRTMIVLPDVINRVSKSETGDFIGIQTLMFPYGNVGTIGVPNVLYI